MFGALAPYVVLQLVNPIAGVIVGLAWLLAITTMMVIPN